MSAELSQLVSRLEVVTSRLESVASGGQGGGAKTEALAAFVVAFDDILNGAFKQFLELSTKIGGDVQGQSSAVKSAFDETRGFIVVASKSKQPAPEALQNLLKPLSEKLKDVEDFVSKHRSSEYFNHLSAIGSALPALGWVTISPTPGPFVREMSDSGQFYINRVLKDFKEKDKVHGDWTKAWMATMREMEAYIKQYHTTGLSWNPQGGDAAAVSQKPAPSAGGAPPPPGPPPPGAPPPPGPPPPPSAEDAEAATRNALFADLNKGADITKGLKKITKDQMTHKNPDLRLHSAVPYKPTPNPKPVVKSFGTKKVESVKPPKCALEGKKWIVENQVSNKNVVISDTNNKQTVYIFKCENSTIQVKGKINSIVLDTCKKTALVFDDVISSLDVINCQSVQAQVTGKVLTVNIDKTDGCMVYLSAPSLMAEIIAAKSSEMNILVPGPDGEFKEFALPEQYKSVWNGKRFATEATDVMG